MPPQCVGNFFTRAIADLLQNRHEIGLAAIVLQAGIAIVFLLTIAIAHGAGYCDGSESRSLSRVPQHAKVHHKHHSIRHNLRDHSPGTVADLHKNTRL